MSVSASAPAPVPVQYLLVCEDERDEPVELPAEEDGSVLLSTVAAQFYGCCGLKYRGGGGGGGALRGLRLADDRLYPPAEGGWGDRKYVCVFPKRREGDARDEEQPQQQQQQQRQRRRSRADAKPRCSDLIVLGLPWKTDEDAVREYFSAFGELPLVQIKRDPKTGNSKGFGFVKFADHDAQLKALGQRHLIDGRWCDVRVPNSKEGLAPKAPSKVFVGRCTEAITADDLREYFGKFGQVTDVFVPRPFRAFGFVTFSDPEVAQSLCGEDHIVKGVSVNVSNASPKREQRRPKAVGHRGGRAGAQQWGRVGADAARGGAPAPPPPPRAVDRPVPLGVGSIPVNQALVAAALNRAGWGLVNNVPVEGYQPPPGAQPGPASHQRGNFFNWVPQNGNGGDAARANQWQHQPDASVKSYVKYE